jgi:hypothetical protein
MIESITAPCPRPRANATASAGEMRDEGDGDRHDRVAERVNDGLGHAPANARAG